MFKKLGRWAKDYMYLARGTGYLLRYRRPPGHYLNYTQAGKVPVILIPGVFEKWHFLKFLADPISKLGHPVYVVPRLGFNSKEIKHSAALVRELIDQENLKNVILLAHSKGGLIGKYVLVFHNQDQRVKKLIAITTPFAGTKLAHFLPDKHYSELRPGHSTLATLDRGSGVNRMIVSIFGEFDNHVWPVESCRLPGAKNIQVPTHGHHQILFSPEVREIILREAR